MLLRGFGANTDLPPIGGLPASALQRYKVSMYGHGGVVSRAQVATVSVLVVF
jgi:hypothetical protein